MASNSSLPCIQEQLKLGGNSADSCSFRERLAEENISILPTKIDTLQINITKLCNQACLHCHVDAGPKRRESMSRAHLEQCLALVAEHPELTTLDITGGAPELHPDFTWFVSEARKLGAHVMARHNLTVTVDPHPLNGASMRYLPEFYAKHTVEVISSLPCYTEELTDKQRGRGVFEKSIESLRLLNEQGYGTKGEDLTLNLVYNPVGAILPGKQEDLEAGYKKELGSKYGIQFNSLFVITNMPIKRFRTQLEREGILEEYMTKLINAFNPHAARGVMCQNLLSVGHDGTLYDCDFNQMLDLPIAECSLDTFNLSSLKSREIRFGSHCFGCTAGAGSSCGGQIS